MSVEPLDSIEWRGLLVSAFCISQNGLSLTVAPCFDSHGSAGIAVLQLSEADSISVQLSGAMAPGDFGAMEIGWLTYVPSGSDHISGTIGLMPGDAGFWQISFTNALWELSRA